MEYIRLICSLLFAMSKINIVLCNVIFKNYEGPQNSSPN
jgi:hypothetical protein